MSALPDLPDLATQAHILATQHGVAIPVSAQAEVWLRAVWGAMPAGSLVGLVGADEYIKAEGIRATSTPVWMRWGDELTPLLEWAEALNNKRFLLEGQGGIYWNAASRKESVLDRYHARGKHSELAQITSFFCDLDAGKRGYSLAEGVKVLLSMPLPPSGIIFSGGGLQAVHILSEAWSIPNEAAVLEYKDYSLALYKPTFDAAGLKLDTSVHEAGREMRLPGYVNRKKDRNTFARIIYWHPEIVYSPAEIREKVALLPSKPRLAPYLPITHVLPGDMPAGSYAVTHDFIHYLIEGNAPVERHPTMLKLANQAARAGIPSQDFTDRMRPIAERWFSVTGELHRAGYELDSAVNWAYTRRNEDRDEYTGYGDWLVLLTPDGFKQADAITQELHRNKPVEITPAPEALQEAEPEPKQSLETVRAEQATTLRQYQAAKTHGMGTYLLMRTSPGAGKTYLTLKAAERYAKEVRDTGETEGKVAMLTLFKDPENGAESWQKRIHEHGGDPSLYRYMVARNGDPSSAGYCSHHKQAERVANKGYVVTATLCTRCPDETECKLKWYRSQFLKAQEAPILLARHQHGMIQELMQQRDFIIFDESPLEIISKPTIVKLDDLIWTAENKFHEMQSPKESSLLRRWVKVIHDIVALNLSVDAHTYPTAEHVKLGGKWFFDRLAHELGAGDLAEIAGLALSMVREIVKSTLPDTSIEAVETLPLNWILDTWRVFEQEYHKHYQQQASSWNSRLIVWANELRIYPMGAFSFKQKTKIVITDATGLPHLYGKAFVYPKEKHGEKSELPREGHVYEGKLTPKSQIIQFTGTDHSKTSLRKESRPQSTRTEKLVLMTLMTTDKGELGFDAEDFAPDPDNLARIKTLILELIKQHAGSLLIVSYMEFAQKLREWNRQYKLLPEEQIQWYRSLRGKNDYKNLNAVLLIGTPRIPKMDLLALAQVWYWNDEFPIDDTPLLRIEPYPDYLDPEDGKPRGYQYIGFADERVNALYVGLVSAEMRQCYERIRPNASLDADGSHIEKHVYIASGFPCTDHVNMLTSWATWGLDLAGMNYYTSQLAQGKAVFQSDFTEHIMKKMNCSYNTAKACFERILARTASNGVEQGRKKKPQKLIVLDWLAQDPIRAKLSSRVIAKELGVHTEAVQAALKEFKR